VMCNVDMPYKVNILRLEHFWAQKKVQNEVVPTVTPIGQNEEWKPLKLSTKQIWQRNKESITWELVCTMGDGAGKRVMKCEMCTQHDKEGSGGERQSQ
jgi:hypothetical protein